MKYIPVAKNRIAKEKYINRIFSRVFIGLLSRGVLKRFTPETTQSNTVIVKLTTSGDWWIS